jgi:rubrerythrin
LNLSERPNIMSASELEKLLRDQMVLEEKTAEVLGATVQKTKNSVVRLFLNRLVLDSLKHADMLQALIDLRSGTIVTMVDKEEMKDSLEKHIIQEKDMLKRLEQIMERVEEPKTKSLLKQIEQDEKRHHRILDEVTKIVSWRGATDEQWWNAIDRPEWLF